MDNYTAAKNIILDPTKSITLRTRALFILRNEPGDESIEFMMKALSDPSVLLKHEICYVLGQLTNERSLKTLRETLFNNDEDEIVRHEAGEALGNFLTDRDFLKFFLRDESKSVAETCYIAIKKAEDHAANNYDQMVSPFMSIDPAFPYTGLSIEELKDKYLNSKCIYESYKAMFTLRNLRTTEAVHILGEGMKHESALFRHEVAFVFGQLKKKESVKYLIDRLCDESEHEMVRHECAEALGAVGCDEGYDALIKYKDHANDILRESVAVALDIQEYEIGDDPEYAKI